MIKKWIPFSILITVAAVTFVNLLLFSEDPYKPLINDPDIIFYEACSDCHGDIGQGSGILYPALDTLISKDEIKKNIVKGGWLMPKFEHIHGDTLKNLVNYIYEQKYRE